MATVIFRNGESATGAEETPPPAPLWQRLSNRLRRAVEPTAPAEPAAIDAEQMFHIRQISNL